jgi:prepilin-type N-terminal cleavage/methylation domain-containing protein
MHHRRGFNLIELAVAMTISGLIGAAALMVFRSVSATRTRIGRMTIADDNAKVLGHYLEREAQRVGGSRLRPWQAIGIEDENGSTPFDCSAGGLPCVIGDRLTFAFAVAGFVPESCSIDTLTSSDGMNSGTIKFKKEFDIGGVKQCCIEVRQGEEGPFNAPPDDLVNTHAIISSGNKHFGLTFVSSLSNCQFRWVRSGQVKPLSSGFVNVGDFDRLEGVAPNKFQVTGFAVPVDVATFFVGCADASGCKCDPVAGCRESDHPEQRALFLFSDRDAATTPAGQIVYVEGVDRLELITAGVLDFQVSVLADIDGDGNVTDDGSSATDEVFGNDIADSTISGGRSVWMSGASELNLTGKMRGMRFEVITGVMTHDPAFAGEVARQISIVRPVPLQKHGMHVRRTAVAAAFRNLNILK